MDIVGGSGSVLQCQMSQRMRIELDIKQIANLYNLISVSDLIANQFSVRRKSENQIKSKLEHLQKKIDVAVNIMVSE